MRKNLIDSAHIPAVALAFAVALLALYVSAIMPFGYISGHVSAASAVFVASFLCFAIFLVAYRGRYRHSVPFVFLLPLVFSFAFASDQFLLPGLLARMGTVVAQYVLSLAVTLPFLLAVPLASKFARHSARSIAITILFVLLAAVWFYMASGVVYANGIASDEQFIAALAARSLLGGGNPYTLNASNMVLSYALRAKVAVTFTSANKVIGGVNYPALYFLSYVPFVLAATAHTVLTDFNAVRSVFLCILLCSVIFLLHGARKKSKYLIWALFTLLVFGQPAPIDFAVGALLLIAYLRPESRLSWVGLGLAVSMQEIAWLPALLLVIYQSNKFGWGCSLGRAAYAAIVFAAINAYFVISGPGAFLRAIASPLGNLFPNPFAVFGYYLLSVYPLPAPVFPILFCAAAIVLSLTALRTQRKEILLLLSMLPMLLMDHALGSYITFFLALFLSAMYFAPDHKARTAESKINITGKVFTIGLIAMLLLLAVYVLAEYVIYAPVLSLHLYNSSLSEGQNSTEYAATLHYASTAALPQNVYAITYIGYAYNASYGAMPVTPYPYGIINTSRAQALTGNYSEATNYSIIINPESIHILGSGSMQILVRLPPHVANVRCNIYSRNVVYICPPLSNAPLSVYSP